MEDWKIIIGCIKSHAEEFALVFCFCFEKRMQAWAGEGLREGEKEF